MGAEPRGVIAAGHHLSAEAGAAVLREGGNAVDAAVAAVLAATVCEPLLTSLGAGGYLLYAEPDVDPILLDFFVEAPGRGEHSGASEMLPVEVSFGDAVQIFNIGPAAVGTYGLPLGMVEAARRFGTLPLADLAAPAVRLARDGVEIVRQQGYLLQILEALITSTPECAAIFAPGGHLLRVGDRLVQPELGDSLERLGAEGAAPFYTGDIARAVTDWLQTRGGVLGPEDLQAFAVIDRQPVRASYRGHDVVTNPPPSAGGILIAAALAALDRAPSPPSSEQLVEAMELAQASRTPEFLDGLDTPGFAETFLRTAGRLASSSPLGSTTHISVLDAGGRACAVTSSAGSTSGVIIPGTGLHLNNMMGEQDLNPHGFHSYPPGRRLPSMMAPTIVERDGKPRLVLGSAGSNRIRSAILQTIVHVIDEGLHADEAVAAPRLHFEDGVVYLEPGIDAAALERAGRTVARFRAPNLFFGGTQAVGREADGRFWGGGDPRRGGAAVLVDAAEHGE